ncbi:hypothetical protein SAMN02745121_04842 [Nannocystis exedens]|uniref:Uncharacterized protein n=2 Tax=Nannocystis exedens TaxID=54 RepID=A0A1I2BY24_9BACT|nr:hypothetical protein NAEX_04268 [Nannocystis exedens]SFE60832.1 hypothetical protein SAMN02745121_04842 [Nannocystis exedens]
MIDRVRSLAALWALSVAAGDPARAARLLLPERLRRARRLRERLARLGEPIARVDADIAGLVAQLGADAALPMPRFHERRALAMERLGLLADDGAAQSVCPRPRRAISRLAAFVPRPDGRDPAELADAAAVCADLHLPARGWHEETREQVLRDLARCAARHMAYGTARLSDEEARSFVRAFVALAPADARLLRPDGELAGNTFEYGVALIHPARVAVFAVGDED